MYSVKLELQFPFEGRLLAACCGVILESSGVGLRSRLGWKRRDRSVYVKMRGNVELISNNRAIN